MVLFMWFVVLDATSPTADETAEDAKVNFPPESKVAGRTSSTTTTTSMPSTTTPSITTTPIELTHEQRIASTVLSTCRPWDAAADLGFIAEGAKVGAVAYPGAESVAGREVPMIAVLLFGEQVAFLTYSGDGEPESDAGLWSAVDEPSAELTGLPAGTLGVPGILGTGGRCAFEAPSWRYPEPRRPCTMRAMGHPGASNPGSGPSTPERGNHA